MSTKAALEPEIWVDRHGDALFRYALFRLRDASLAEEMVQETFLAALQASERFGGRSSERTWLVGILKHKIVDHYRRLSRERPAEEDDYMPEAISERFDEHDYWYHELGPREWGESPHAAVERSELWSVLDGCLGEIPPRHAAAFTLREIDEMPTEEICKVLGVSTTNLWVILHRARAHLRLCLETHWVGEGRTDGRR